MTGTAITRERFDLGRVVKHTLGAIRHNAASFAILALVLAGVPALLSTVGLMGLFRRMATFDRSGAPDFSALTTGGALTGAGVLLSVVTGAILQGAIIFGTAAYLNGRPASLADCLGAGLRRCLPLIGLTILTAIALMGGFLLFIVPGIMMSLAWCVTIPALVVERTGVLGAFGRSADLTRGRRWPILGLVVLYSIAVSVAQQVAINLVGLVVATTSPFLTMAHQLPVGAALGVITSVLSSAGVAAIYYELRSTREGAGPEALAAVFD